MLGNLCSVTEVLLHLLSLLQDPDWFALPGAEAEEDLRRISVPPWWIMNNRDTPEKRGKLLCIIS